VSGAWLARSSALRWSREAGLLREHIALAFVGAAAVPLQSMLGGEPAFGPEDVAVMSAAFEDTLRSLGLVDRTDPATTLVAKAIIEAARQGELDPLRLRERALKALRT
jgi:hypothetical protein